MTNFDEDSSYYRAIFDLGPELSDELLPALRDVVADAALYSRALDEDVMGISLLRSVTARSIEGQFRRILAGGTVLTEYSFRYEAPIPQDERVERLTLEFEVTPDSTPPTNIHVLIGRNGVGKTYLLNGMTKALVRPDRVRTTVGYSELGKTCLDNRPRILSPTSYPLLLAPLMTSNLCRSGRTSPEAFAIPMWGCANASRTVATIGLR